MIPNYIPKISAHTLNKKNTLCHNCGDISHHIKNCPKPVISIGMFIYNIIDNEYRFLMVCRRNTIGFVELIRNKYDNTDVDYIYKLINVLTENEAHMLLNKDFKYLWEYIWCEEKYNKISNRSMNDYTISCDKFTKLKKGYIINNLEIKLDKLIASKINKYDEQEWGFPKGRKKYREADIITGLRECKEETSIGIDSLVLDPNNTFFVEEYSSYDNVMYRNIYYIAKYIGSQDIIIDEQSPDQYQEISKLEFLTYDNCLKKIRPYEIEKATVFKKMADYVRN